MSEVGITAATNLREASAEIRRSGSRQVMPPAIREEQQPPPKSTEPRSWTEVPLYFVSFENFVAIHISYSVSYSVFCTVCVPTSGVRSDMYTYVL